MDILFSSLLALHIAAGIISLVSAFIAIGSKIGDMAHRWHVYSGRAFYWGMLVIFITALGMSFIRINVPMLFVAIFSFYFAWMGRRYALNRSGTPTQIDKIAAGGMTLVFAGMILYGLYESFVNGRSFAIVVIVFGIIGILNSFNDWKIIQRGGVKGKTRIAEHLSRMLGGTIATITAFLVVNVEFEPAFVIWLAPTALLTPIIVIWVRKINAGVQRKGMGG